MKRTSYIFALLAAIAALILSSCAKEKALTASEGKLVECILQAEVVGTGAGLDIDMKVALNSDGVTPNWEAGDQILVLDADKKPVGADGKFTLSSGQGTTSGKFTGTVYVGQKPTYAIYPATAATTSGSSAVTAGTLAAPTGNDAGSIKSAVMLGTSSDGKSVSFTNACAVLMFNTGDYGKSGGTDPAIKSVKVSASYGDTATPIAGAFTIDWSATTPSIAPAGSGTVNELTVELPSALQANDKDVYIPIFPLPMESSTAPSMKYVFTNTSGNVAEVSHAFTAAIAAGTLKNLGTAGGMEFKADIPEDALPGVFSVSNDGGTTIKQVHFSKGNLVATIDATGAPTAWKFSAHQYEYIGANVANTKIGKEAGDVDLFGWSTSTNGGTSTTDNYGIKTSTTVSDYSGDFYDWGKAVGDGNTWRTLSKDEWTYLFNNHSNIWATVNGVKGYVIAPDGFDGTLSSTYADDAALAADNLVFLPAAGYRGGSIVDRVGVQGRYWSSSAYDSGKAYLLYFNSVNPDRFEKRNCGHSVRLITESK